MAKKELTERQKAVLKWINDGCPDNDWPETYYKGSARMMASYDLVKIKGRGKEWQAQITQRGKNVLAGVETLTGPSRVKYRAPRRDPASGPTTDKPATPKKIAPPAPPAVDTEQLFEELLAAEFQVITRPLATDDEEARWKDELRRLRSSSPLLADTTPGGRPPESEMRVVTMRHRNSSTSRSCRSISGSAIQFQMKSSATTHP